MPFTLTEFDGLTLPVYKEQSQADELGTGQALTDYIPTPGGHYYDNYGSGDSPLGLDPLTKECMLFESSKSALLTAIDALRAKKGKRGILKATWHTGTVRWLYARMVGIHHPAVLGNLQNAAVTLEFMPEGGVWFHASQSSYTATLTATGGGNQNVVVANGGNVNVTDLTVTVTAGTNSITALTITNTTTGQSLAYTGTIASTKALVVDVGALSILNNGSNGYASLTPSDKADWLYLQPGNNTIRFTVTGNAAANSTYLIQYYPTYA